MDIFQTGIPDVLLIRPRVFEDARGFFFESWNQRTFAEAGLDVAFVQDNQSRSCRATLRGLHYQINHAQGKLVRVQTGEIYDVAVDLRHSSPSFGRWVAARLSDQNHDMLWIPPGFAHGFLVLSESADVLYKTTDFYAPESERTIRWDDPELAIEWPQFSSMQPLLSSKDRAAASFRDAEHFP